MILVQAIVVPSVVESRQNHKPLKSPNYHSRSGSKNAITGDKRSGKAPFGDEWQSKARGRKDSPSWTENINLWAKNTGILCDGLYVIDVDIDDQQVANLIFELIHKHFGLPKLVRYREGYARFLTLYRATGSPTKKKISCESNTEIKDIHAIEVLGFGQQFVADGMHYTGSEIKWKNDISPADLHIDELPLLTEQQMGDFLLEAAKIINANVHHIHGYKPENDHKVVTKPHSSQIKENFSISSRTEQPAFTEADLADLLKHLPSDSGYDSGDIPWLNVMSAIHNIAGPAGEQQARDWSYKSPCFDESGFSPKWRQLCSGNGAQHGAGYLINLVRKFNSDWVSPTLMAAFAAKRGSRMSLIDSAEVDQQNCNFSITDKGLFYVKKGVGEGEQDDRKFVSSPFTYLGRCRDHRSTSWGHLIEWNDPMGKPHRKVIPDSTLGCEQTDIYQELRDSGLTCGIGKTEQYLFRKFFLEAKASRFIKLTKKPGWLDGSYLMADGTKFGNADIALDGVPMEAGSAGSLREWQDSVGALAKGNIHIMFAICVALGGPLLEIMNLPGGDFHFYGKSQTAKTSALAIAASVTTGLAGGLRSWRATDNGLESIALSFNDGTLFLDEIGQCPERADPGKIAYMLANGQQKQRMTKAGAAREVATWRLLYLSTGEHDLAGCGKGKQVKAGQLVRHVDIPMADIGLRELHGFNAHFSHEVGAPGL